MCHIVAMRTWTSPCQINCACSLCRIHCRVRAQICEQQQQICIASVWQSELLWKSTSPQDTAACIFVSPMMDLIIACCGCLAGTQRAVVCPSPAKIIGGLVAVRSNSDLASPLFILCAFPQVECKIENWPQHCHNPRMRPSTNSLKFIETH